MNANKLNSSLATEQCSCQNSAHLVIERARVSRFIALLLVSAFCIFAAGYFLGKKKGAESFSLKVEQEAFADQMNVALHTLYNPTPGIQVGDNEQDEQEENQEVAEAQPVLPVQDQAQEGSSKRYQALLIGGSAKDVNAFAARLNKRGIKVEVKTRQGKTKKGTPITWSQAITPEFSNKEEFDKLIVAIKKTEKINEKILERG